MMPASAASTAPRSEELVARMDDHDVVGGRHLLGARNQPVVFGSHLARLCGECAQVPPPCARKPTPSQY